MTTAMLGVIAVLAPVVAAGILILVGPLRRSGKPAAVIASGGSLIALVSSILLLRDVSSLEPVLLERVWLVAGERPLVSVGVHLDSVSVMMLVVVCLVAFLVQVFSMEYMHDEEPADFGRYYTWHALFLFSMNGLVLAPNLLQLFVCWELVGLCSFLLIGYYHRKPVASRAAMKALWVTKTADVGFLVALLIQYRVTGSFAWDAEVVTALGSTLPWVAGLYFVAVMGKSAQFPLHIWLPDAMEGPTPVSALLHAATMVAAGVYLIVRAFPIFEGSPLVMAIMACVGGTTALFAACMAVVQTDLKRVLAYSTCSQLGYMVAALGAGSVMGGFFHLTTHGFFKALLFLCAGSVIHAVHSNEMTDMGGLFSKMKLTAITFMIGTFALMGLPGFSGFFSKDLVLESLWHHAQDHPLYWYPTVACLIGAGLTAYYMGRAMFMTFFGKASEKAEHAHEGGLWLTMPLVLLAVGALSVGWFGGAFGHRIEQDYHFVLSPSGIIAMVLALGGLTLSYLQVIKGMAAPAALAPLGRLVRSGAVDKTAIWSYRTVLLGLSGAIGWLDRFVVDGAINWLGAAVLRAGGWLRKMQTGRVNDYVYVVVVGALLLLVLVQVGLS